MPPNSPSDGTLSKFLLIGAVTLVLALAFGADLWSPDTSSGYAEWKKRAASGKRTSWLPWGDGRRRKLDAVTEARMRLSDEHKRRLEAEKSLFHVRERMGRVSADNDALRTQLADLEKQLADQGRELFDLRVENARAEAVSPELVDRFIDMAEDALRVARFEVALALVRDADAWFGVLPPEEILGRMRRLELVRSTALVALGDEEAAAQSLGRLLDADPDFAIDSDRSSPKLIRVLDRLRAERAPVARAGSR